MSYDPQSPSDRADMEPDVTLQISLCEWCDEAVDPVDVDVEAFERFGGLICRECADARNDDGQPDEAQEWADFDREC